MGPGITWYDVLGVLPGAAAQEIQRNYDSKASLLRPERVAGAPSAVVTAASRAQGILDAAWRVLGDPAIRARYDEAAGLRRSGGGLAPPGSYPSEPGWGLTDFGFHPDGKGAVVLGGLMALTGWLTPHPRQPNRVTVPDVRGLFYSVCSAITGRAGLHLATIRLTEHPVPVDGLIVDQSPSHPAMVRRNSTLTVRVWHPPARSAAAQ